MRRKRLSLKVRQLNHFSARLLRRFLEVRLQALFHPHRKEQPRVRYNFLTGGYYQASDIQVTLQSLYQITLGIPYDRQARIFHKILELLQEYLFFSHASFTTRII